MKELTFEERIDNAITIADETVFGLCELESPSVDSDAILLGIIRTAMACLTYRGWDRATAIEHLDLGILDGHDALADHPLDRSAPKINNTIQ